MTAHWFESSGSYERLNHKKATHFIDKVLDRLPFRVEASQAEFQSSFHWHLLEREVGHLYIKAATPRLNGKIERSRRIDDEEFSRLLWRLVTDDAAILNAKRLAQRSCQSGRRWDR